MRFMPAGSMPRLMRAVLIYMRVNLCLWEVGKELEKDLTVADSILRKVTALLSLAVSCLREYVKPLCLFANLNSITDAGGQTCSLFLNLTAPRLAFISTVSLLSPLSVQLLERPRPKQRWVSFHYSAPSLIHYPHLKGVSCY